MREFNGNIIKVLRKENGETQDDLAALIGTSAPLVSQWETGARVPSTPMLRNIADHYRVSMDSFFKEGNA